jgi:hypothetical protein
MNKITCMGANAVRCVYGGGEEYNTNVTVASDSLGTLYHT